MSQQSNRKINTVLDRKGKFFIFVSAICTTLLSLVVPLSILVLFEKIIPNQSNDSLVVLYLIIVGSLVLDYTIKKAENSYINRQSSESGSRLLNDVFDSFIYSSKNKFKRKKYGVFLEEVRGIEQSRESLMTENTKMAATATSGLFMLLVIFGIEPITGLILAFASVVTYAWTHQFKRIRSSTLVAQSGAEGQANTSIIDIITSPYRVKSASMEYRAERFVSPRIDQREHLGALTENLSSRVNSHIALANQLFLFVVVGVAAIRVITGDISQGVMAAIILLVNRYFGFLQQFITFDQSKSLNRRVTKSINDIFELVDQSNDLAVVDSLERLEIFDQDIERGRIYFLNGRSGTGKSLIQKYLSQEAINTQDVVKVNALPINEVEPNFAKKFVTRVTRHGQYIDGTIIDNLTCFEASRHNLCYYLTDTLGIRTTFDSLPKGFYTELARTQRLPFNKKVSYLALVIRASLCEPEILLLDNVDQTLTRSETEKLAHILANQRRNQFTVIATKYQIDGELFSTIHLEENSRWRS